MPFVATQSISSLHDNLPGKTWRTVLQSFRPKIFLTQTDLFSARTASELCGKEGESELQQLDPRARRPGEPLDGQIRGPQGQRDDRQEAGGAAWRLGARQHPHLQLFALLTFDRVPDGRECFLEI